MVRNEADVVESFVRHNLTVVDRLYVVDHGSFDGTGAILAALVAEGLPLVVAHDASLAHFQPQVATASARRAFADGADFVFPLDADEFLLVPDRTLLEQVLAHLPADLPAVLHWLTWLVDFEAPAGTPPLAAARSRLAAERHGLHKVVLGPGFAANPMAMVGPGNHTVWPDGPGHQPPATQRLARITPEVARIAHVPVRSARQIVHKVTLGWLARRASRPLDPGGTFHWRDLGDDIRRDGPPSPARLAEITVNYSVPRAQWLPASAVPRTDEPLPVSVATRYDALARHDIDEQVAALAQQLARAADAAN
jgi:Glycosyl transferase family 2